jgi:hypothetical protein
LASRSLDPAQITGLVTDATVVLALPQPQLLAQGIPKIAYLRHFYDQDRQSYQMNFRCTLK